MPGSFTGVEACRLELFDRNHWLKRAKLPVANAAHHQQMLCSPKLSVSFAMRDDSLSDALANTGKCLKFLRRSGVDVYQWNACGLRRIETQLNF